jgi:4-alpha-glucanotransferase
LLRARFDATFPSLSQSAPYQTFLKQNPWLESYSHFKALKEACGGKNWIDWPSLLPVISRSAIDFYSFLQFHCFAQMEQVRAHAARQRVFIQGDIPILVSPDSADVWAERDLFHLDLEAGAPPDLYNPQGQKWGFPLFNWDAMRKTQFAWWKRRLKLAERLFHLYRIDHVVGFFRIWGIVRGHPATAGSFFPPDPSLWAAQGRELLEMMLDATTLLERGIKTIGFQIPQRLRSV